MFKCAREDFARVRRALVAFDHVDPNHEELSTGVKFYIDLALLPNGDGPCAEAEIRYALETVVALKL